MTTTKKEKNYDKGRRIGMDMTDYLPEPGYSLSIFLRHLGGFGIDSQPMKNRLLYQLRQEITVRAPEFTD